MKSYQDELIDILKKHKCGIFGSYVYKHLLRGEKVDEIDVFLQGSTSSLIASLEIAGCERIRMQPDIYEVVRMRCDSTHSSLEYCEGSGIIDDDIITVDIVQKDTYLKLALFQPAIINHVVYDHEWSLQHPFKEEYYLKCPNLSSENCRVVKNMIKSSVYYPWNTMRPKDVKYFEDWVE